MTRLPCRPALAALFVLLAPAIAFADGPAPSSGPAATATSDTPDVAKARDEFVRGAELVKQASWGEALAAFERSASLRPHAVTTFNVGACERAMGMYTRARRTLGRALAENDAARGAELPATLVTEIHGYITQLDSLFATATVTLLPASAAVAVDGRPLEVVDLPPRAGEREMPVLMAGTRAPGPGEPPPASEFKVILDPGPHVFTLSRKGFADAVTNKNFLPGSTTDLRLHLDLLPATLHVASFPSGAIVTVGGADVGATPVDVSRPAGSYDVVVRKGGFVTYETAVVAQPGEDVSLSPNLPKEKIALTQRWWFWTAVGVVVAGAAVGTYFVARGNDSPQRPPLDGGGLGWTMQMR